MAQPKLYAELAPWWPLVSPPADHAEEAELYRRVLLDACAHRAETLLELGSGGGNNAFHLKASLRVTLVDISPPMLAVSRALNPECEHLVGDMRKVRLDRRFDLVLVHDAICCMSTETDLRQALESAFAHCEPGGAVLLAPDWTRESFRGGTYFGGRDGERGGVRYLEWVSSPTPGTYTAEFAFMLREGNDSVRVVRDRHICGLFSRQVWLDLLSAVGFRARALPFPFPDIGSGERRLETLEAERIGAEIFVGTRPKDTSLC